jgi:lysophospholipase L1-like esterase
MKNKSLLRFLLPRMLISLCVVILVFISAEAYLRIFGTYVKPYGWTFKTGPDDVMIMTPLGKRNIPNQNVLIINHPQSHRDIPITINSLGFRGPEIGEKKTGGTRLLILGDSIAFSDALPEEKTWVSLLEKQLNSSGSAQFQVINGGVGDIGMKEELDLLSETADAVRPDVVVLAYYPNDSRPPWGFTYELGRRGFLRRYSVFAETIYRWLVSNNWMKQKGIDRDTRWDMLAARIDWKNNKADFLRLAQSAAADWGAGWEKSEWGEIDMQLKRLQDLASKYHFKAAIVAFPVMYQVESTFVEDTPQKTMKQKADSFGFAYLDLLPVLREQKKDPLFFDHCHPNEKGSDIAAKAITSFLPLSVFSHDTQ